MNKAKIVSTIVGLIYFPISLYLTFWIISQLNPDRLIWFLYWINIPFAVIITIISKVVTDDD